MSKYENSQKNKGFELNIIDYLLELSRRWWLIILVAVICGLIGGGIGLTTRNDVYASHASFIVNTLSKDETAENSAVSAQINIANTFDYILKSPVMKHAIYEACPGRPSYKLIDESLDVEVIPSTFVIEMHVKTGDAETSYNIAKTACLVYGDIVKDIYPNASLNICSRPTKALAPEPDRVPLLIALASAVAGVAVLCIIILILFILKDTVKSPEELSEKINMPVLGSVQNVTNKTKADKGLLIADKRIGFSFIETYKAIRTKIESHSARTGHKVFLVTSACENEGKTTVSVNIALSLAQNGKSVLLIDADLRNPSVSKILSLPETDFGFIDVVKGHASLDQAIKKINEFDIFLLADQHPVSNPSEILSMKITEDIIESVRQHFDYIIIDTAPASIVTDSSIISGLADAAIMVVREDTSPLSRIRMSIEDIDSNGAEIVGCVFNGDTSSSATGGKFGKYGRYGRYGRYGKYGGYGGYGGYGSYGSSKSKNK